MTKNIIIILAFIALSGCAQSMTGADAGSAGFFSGLWHGFICVFSLIGHMFNENIAVYQTPNNGGWYDFGFLVGAGAFASSSSKRVKRK